VEEEEEEEEEVVVVVVVVEEVVEERGYLQRSTILCPTTLPPGALINGEKLCSADG